MQELKGKHIVLGITGSIAAYKACVLARLLIKEGAEVQVVITPAGKEFITPLTLSTLTRRPVVSEFFDRRDGQWNSHVDLGLWADLMLVAPATAATLAKMAAGVADNMLVTTYLSMKAPVAVAPAMDLDMFAHPATQANIETLRQRGNVIVEPASGELASGLVGKGRMAEPEEIVEAVRGMLTVQDLCGKRVLITAGPTYERIDPVRFVGNYSSGKMGFALAEECALRGAEVELITGPTSQSIVHKNIKVTRVESAEEMRRVAVEAFEGVDAAILSAAVSDFCPAEPKTEKIKRTGEELLLRLRPTHDIAAELGRAKKEGQVLVGFALETQDELENARGKLERKNLDMIVLNSLREKGAGFGCDTNKVVLLSKDGEQAFELKSKREVAHDIVDALRPRIKD